MSTANLYRVALLAGLLLAATLASTCVAVAFGSPAELGEPLVGPVHAPWRVVAWWRAWGAVPPYRATFQAALLAAGLIALAPLFLVRLLHVYGKLRLSDRDRGRGLGDARALRRFGAARTSGPGVVIGRAGRFGPVLRDPGDGHVLIMGPARSGKGAGHVVPTLLVHAGSVLAVDPKRELHAITGRRRRELGPVFVVDPTAAASARLNPLLEIRTGSDGRPSIGDCQNMAEMIARSGHVATGKDEVWDDATADLATTLLHHVRASGAPTLAHLNRLVVAIKAGRYPKAASDYVGTNLDAHRRLHDKVRDSVNFTLRTRLAFLDDPLVHATTAASDFRPGDLMAASSPVTLFLSVPSDQRRRLRPLTRLLLQSLWAPLTHDIGRVADGRAKLRPCLALIDEFPQLGRMDVLEHGIADCAGYGLRVALVCQDIDQINAAYGTNQSITANCSTVCAIPGFSGHGLATMTKWAGEQAVAHASRQLGAGWRGSASMSDSEARIAVLNPRDMLARGTDEVLVFARGVAPTWLRQVRYWKDRPFRGMFEAPIGDAAPAIVPPNDPDEELPPWLLTQKI